HYVPNVCAPCARSGCGWIACAHTDLASQSAPLCCEVWPNPTMGQIMPDRDGQPSEETAASPASGSAPAVPQLSGAQFERMTAYGVAQPVAVGDVVFGPGDVDYDLVLVESGWIEIISPATGDEPES